MELKKTILVLGITISVITGILFGTSYAWYAYSNAETKIGGSTVKEKPTVIFSQTEYVYSKESLPINDEDRYNYGNKNSFTVTFGEELKEYKVGIEISLNDISMSNDLKISNYKYELLQNGVKVATGDFSSIGSENTLTIMPMVQFTPLVYPVTYNYELYIWLSDDGTNQNYLMNKGFSARINVNSAIKK